MDKWYNSLFAGVIIAGTFIYYHIVTHEYIRCISIMSFLVCAAVYRMLAIMERR
jgi:formate/nitrite transporter FocA (FNT family)